MSTPYSLEFTRGVWKAKLLFAVLLAAQIATGRMPPAWGQFVVFDLVFGQLLRVLPNGNKKGN